MKRLRQKSVSKLTLDDFTDYPVWTWAEDDKDESLVMPLIYSGSLPEDCDALFVACKFLLADGTESAGVVSVRMHDRSVYLISFPEAGGKFFDFPLRSPLKNSITREQLAVKLGKSLDCVFPIAYTTPYVFSNGQPFVGQIE